MGKNLFRNFLADRDSFGQPLQLVYKGSSTHNTALGGIFSILVNVMTLIMMIRACEELVYMDDPTIINQTKPLTNTEKADLIPIKFDRFDFVVAFQTFVIEQETGEG